MASVAASSKIEREMDAVARMPRDSGCRTHISSWNSVRCMKCGELMVEEVELDGNSRAGHGAGTEERGQ